MNVHKLYNLLHIDISICKEFIKDLMKCNEVKPNANKSPIGLARHNQPQPRTCVNSNWAPTSSNASGGPHTVNFNAIFLIRIDWCDKRLNCSEKWHEMILQVDIYFC